MVVVVWPHEAALRLGAGIRTRTPPFDPEACYVMFCSVFARAPHWSPGRGAGAPALGAGQLVGNPTRNALPLLEGEGSPPKRQRDHRLSPANPRSLVPRSRRFNSFES
jgi:hypothetical protein